MSVFTPHPYQDMVLDRMDPGKLALLLDPGMGKTPTSLEHFRRQRECGMSMRGLVVAPLRVCYSVWPAEVEKWDQFRDMKVHIAHDKGLDVSAINDADLVVTNPNSLKWIENNRSSIERFDTLFADESTLFKRPNVQRSKSLYRTLNGTIEKSKKRLWTIPNRFILTGTPAPNGLGDLFGQFGLLSTDILGKTLKQFRSDFRFMPRTTSYGVEWDPTPETGPLIYERVAPWSVRLDADDYLDLPELVEVETRFPLPQEARSIYDKLRKEMYVDLDSGNEVVAMNPGVLSAKCKQIANGHIYVTDDGQFATGETKKFESIHNGKSAALADLWDENGQKPMLVAYEYKSDVESIRCYFQRRYGWMPPYIGGGVSGADGDALVKEWNLGNLPMLCVHPQTAAHGLNMQSGGSHVVWYSNTWDLEWYDQLKKRLHRQGQLADTVFVHHLIAEGTVDDVITRARGRKAKTQDDLFEAIKEAA